MNICIFGDSITYGAFDTEKGGWVNRLHLYLDSKMILKTKFIILVFQGIILKGYWRDLIQKQNLEGLTF